MIHRTTFMVRAKLEEELFHDAKIVKAVLDVSQDGWVGNLLQLKDKAVTCRVEKVDGKLVLLLIHEESK